jgi:two-component system chemotaxis sensor kinase CheA
MSNEHNAGVDDDIRADFLVEAGELVQVLGEQLVQLEQHSSDQNLLNAIFRAFHTVKGGAGFLGLTPMVALCHAAEDVFNALRSGKRSIDADLMDAVLQASDNLQTMMSQVATGAEITPATPELLARLHTQAQASVAAAPAPVAVAPASTDSITDDEFDSLLDQLHGSGKAPGAAPKASAPAQISEDEFDALLDQLHGAGKAPGAAAPAEKSIAGVAAKVPAVTPATVAPETSVRVDTLRLDKMMNLVGELVLVRNRLKTLRKNPDPETLTKTIGQLDHITRNLQDAVMQIRMQPVKKVFSRFPKVARDLARSLGKQVEVTLQGEETDLDKNLVEALADPLVHMVRNAVDHGIEMPEARLRANKPAAGKLVLAATQEGDHILITVSDDGAGIDPERLRAKVIEKGLMDASAVALLTAEECLQLVFMPGFSTKEQISDLSGRGVGMDVVKSAITRLNGSVMIESKPGQGSLVRIRVPLTLAILPALMVAVHGRMFAMPLSAVVDVFVYQPERIRRLDQWDVVLVRDKTLRLVHLQRWVGAPVNAQPPQHVVVARAGDEAFGFVVDQVRAREEVVIKPLGVLLRGLAGLAGATVTGEGRVALILDLASLVQAYGHT